MPMMIGIRGNEESSSSSTSGATTAEEDSGGGDTEEDSLGTGSLDSLEEGSGSGTGSELLLGGGATELLGGGATELLGGGATELLGGGGATELLLTGAGATELLLVEVPESFSTVKTYLPSVFVLKSKVPRSSLYVPFTRVNFSLAYSYKYSSSAIMIPRVPVTSKVGESVHWMNLKNSSGYIFSTAEISLSVWPR